MESNETIEILNFIFHVVHHGPDDPILMDETPITGFEYFFKERVREVVTGNKFFFNPTSEFLSQVRQIQTGEKSFLEISKELAKKFHAIQDDRIKPGVMILMKIRYAGNELYILIKYDHENVIYYTKISDNKAILSEISNTFSKSKEALQKSAIIHLAEEPFTVVVDKSERSHITKFFKSYLGIKRSYTPVDLTDKVRDCFLATVKTNSGSLPKEFTAGAQKIFYDAVQQTANFEFEGFLSSVFGTNHTPEIRDAFIREMRRKDIVGESFEFNKDIKPPRIKKYRTSEGVSISYSENAKDTVRITHSLEETTVTITTKKLVEET